jgi:hypothetical protein
MGLKPNQTDRTRSPLDFDPAHVQSGSSATEEVEATQQCSKPPPVGEPGCLPGKPWERRAPAPSVTLELTAVVIISWCNWLMGL